MLKYDLHAEMQINFIEITFWYAYFLVNFLHFFRTPFPKNPSGGLLLNCP